jgi:chromosome segregation ATPase
MVSYSTYLSHGNQIRNLINQINQTNARIAAANNRIASLKQQLSSEKINRTNAYNTKEDWRQRVEELKRLISDETDKINQLKTDLEALQSELRRLQGLLNAANTNQRELSEAERLLITTSNAKIIQNIDTNNKYYSDIQRQNKTLYNTLIEIKSDLTTYDQKSINESNNISRYETMHNGLLYLYYISAIILFYFLYSKQYVANKYAFVLVIASIALYPYYILNVEKYIYSTFAFIWALIKGIPYKNE